MDMKRRTEAVDTSGDLALAEALAREEEIETNMDEELALALAMEEEEREQLDELELEYQQLRDQQIRREIPQKVPPPKKKQVEPSGPAQSMFDRIVSTFRGRSVSTEKQLENEQKVLKAKQRLDRQRTLVFNTMEVLIPDFIATEDFMIMKPDGSVEKIHVPSRQQHPPFQITYDGEPQVRGSPRILEDSEQYEAFLHYYRFNPLEIEADVQILSGPRPLGGLELISQEEGVFVKWGVLPLPGTRKRSFPDDIEDDDERDDEDQLPSLHVESFDTTRILCAGDLIVKIGEEQINSLDMLRPLIASHSPGSKVHVRALRKPAPVVRCPQGHSLKLDDPRVPFEIECASCMANFGRYSCAECEFSLCRNCFSLIYARSKARFPRPVNNDHEYTEAPSNTRLTFSEADVGTKLLVFWYTTGEWWIGQVESYHPNRGHVIVYEERNGNMCRETVSNFTFREYRILTHCVLGSSRVQPFHKQIFGDNTPQIQPFENEPLLNLDEPLQQTEVYSSTQKPADPLLQLDEPWISHENQGVDLLSLGSSLPPLSQVFEASSSTSKPFYAGSEYDENFTSDLIGGKIEHPNTEEFIVDQSMMNSELQSKEMVPVTEDERSLLKSILEDEQDKNQDDDDLGPP